MCVERDKLDDLSGTNCLKIHMITHGLIKELLHQIIEKKNIQRKKLKKTQSLMDVEKYKSLRRETKQFISKKKRLTIKSSQSPC